MNIVETWSPTQNVTRKLGIAYEMKATIETAMAHPRAVRSELERSLTVTENDIKELERIAMIEFLQEPPLGAVIEHPREEIEPFSVSPEHPTLFSTADELGELVMARTVEVAK